MSITEQRGHLIAYDISEPRRLVRVHRFLRSRALAVQYSVFAGVLSQRQMAGMLEELEKRIDPKSDDVRVYPLTARCEAAVLGKGRLPEGVHLSDTRLVEILPAGGSAARSVLEAGTESGL